MHYYHYWLWTIVVFPFIAQAEIVLDGSLGKTGRFSGNDVTIGAEWGEQHGGNLFHSFESFSIAPSQTVTFTAPVDTSNIISRVTGGQVSLFEGQLRSPSSANFYFLNPAGVIFGIGSSVADVVGSFYVSTANTLRFADGSQFNTVLSEQALLSSAPPVAFGFLSTTPASIAVEGRGLFLREPNAVLSLVGGNLKIGDSTDVLGESTGLYAPAQINLVSLKGVGDVTQVGLGLALPDGVAQGDIFITDSTIGLRDNSKPIGNIIIQGDKIDISNSDIFRRYNTNHEGSIHLVANQLMLTQVHIQDESAGADNGNEIRLVAEDISISDNSHITASKNFAAGGGEAGSIYIKGENIVLENKSSIRADNLFGTKTGNIEIIAQQLKLDEEAWIGSTNYFYGKSGYISIKADSLSLNNQSVIWAVAFNLATAGDIQIDANNMSLSNWSAIMSNISRNSSNATEKPSHVEYQTKAGNILIRVTNRLSLINNSLISSASDIAKGTEDIIDTNYGRVDIFAGNIFLNDHSVIDVGASNLIGGDISVHTRNILYMKEGSGLHTSSELGTGRGGNIFIDTNLFVLDGSGLIAQADEGKGGNITINANRRVHSQDNPPVFSVSSRLGESGEIVLNAPVDELNNLLIKLPANFPKDPFVRCISRAMEAAGSSLREVPEMLQRTPIDFDSATTQPIYLTTTH